MLERNALLAKVLQGDSKGRPKDVQFASILVKNRWDKSDRLRFSQAASGTSALFTQSYEYDASGDLLWRHDLLTRTDEKFEYDGADRLVKWKVSQPGCTQAAVFTWTYDGHRHLKQTTGPGANNTFVYGESAGPHVLTHVNGSALAYDAVGNEKSAPGRTIGSVTAYGLPRQMTVGTLSTTFKYGGTHQQVIQTYSNGNSARSFGRLYSRESVAGVTKDYHSIQSMGRSSLRLSGPNPQSTSRSRRTSSSPITRIGRGGWTAGGTVLETREIRPLRSGTKGD